uniref:Uncharacterized protein n=1 Tax=Anguilla anguilla TaxID=7936 RepID=A0A0E9VZN7_ANGAN
MLRSGLSCLHANDNHFVHQAMVVLKAQAAGMIKNETAEIKPLLCSPHYSNNQCFCTVRNSPQI